MAKNEIALYEPVQQIVTASHTAAVCSERGSFAPNVAIVPEPQKVQFLITDVIATGRHLKISHHIKGRVGGIVKISDISYIVQIGELIYLIEF